MGNAPAMPHGFFDPVQTMTATIASDLGEVGTGTTHYYSLFAIGGVLFLISLGINLASEAVVRRVGWHANPGKSSGRQAAPVAKPQPEKVALVEKPLASRSLRPRIAAGFFRRK